MLHRMPLDILAAVVAMGVVPLPAGVERSRVVPPSWPSRARRAEKRFVVADSMKTQEEVTPTEARQATMRPRAMVWVLFGSLFLCLMAGLGLTLGWISLPLSR